jgi:alkylation response protein AidB-like acyl-CoA dehydrogenase
VTADLSVGERHELALSVRAACERFSPEERVREVAYESNGKQQGFDTQLWKVLCSQIGVAAIALPEEVGGAGYGAMALGAVAHELGRVLAPVPFVASAVLATGLLVDSGATAAQLSALMAGDRSACALLASDGGVWDPAAVVLTASRGRHGWTIDGTVRHVLNGTAADDLVVVAMVDGELAVFLLDAAAPGVVAQSERVLDSTRPMATVRFIGAPAALLAGERPVDDVIGANIHRALAVLSAEQVGAGERVLEIATEYACTREQFGRPIGGFQAIKHRCADMLLDLEWARSASQAALQSVDDGDGEVGWRASMAKAVCSEALRDASHSNLQIHGGIGFTWEDSAGLYLRRARTDEVLFGTPGQHWDRLAAKAKLV